MTTVPEQILATLFEELGKVPSVNEPMLDALRKLLEKGGKPKAEDLVAAFSIEKKEDGL